MTHTYCLRRLLALGPLTTEELREITGWESGALRSAIGRLMERGEVRAVPIRPRRNLYWLAQ
jgi:hypothetical protein